MQKPRLTLRVPRDELRALKRYAHLSEGKSMSDLLREHLEPLFKAAIKFAKKTEVTPQ